MVEKCSQLFKWICRLGTLDTRIIMSLMIISHWHNAIQFRLSPAKLSEIGFLIDTRTKSLSIILPNCDALTEIGLCDQSSQNHIKENIIFINPLIKSAMHNLYYNCREISCYFNARLLQSTAPHTHIQTYISYWDYAWSIPLPCMLILIALKLNVNNDLKPNKWFSIKWTVQDMYTLVQCPVAMQKKR